jgi:WD40 repeat protein
LVYHLDQGESVAVHLWHAVSGRIIFTLPRLKSQSDLWVTRALAISPDGRLLATYAPDSLNVIQLWDISALDVGPKGKGAKGATYGYPSD